MFSLTPAAILRSFKDRQLTSRLTYGKARFGVCILFAGLALSQGGHIFGDDPPPAPDAFGLHQPQTSPASPVEAFRFGSLDAAGAGSLMTMGGITDIERGYPFIWPASGPITSYMGPVHPTGIDIGLDSDTGVPVIATAAGTVETTGGSDAEAYGLHVLVDHGDGLKTLYAHLSRIGVRAGQEVAQGQQLGYGGSTGKADGPHLHFEVQLDGAVLDPMRLLPAPGVTVEKGTAQCGSTPLVLERGSRTVVDFAGIVTTQQAAMAVAVKAVSTRAPDVDARLVERTKVELNTRPSLRGPDEDAYQLSVRFSDGLTETRFDCEMLVRTRALAPSYFVKVQPTPTRTVFVAPTATSVPVVTNTTVVAADPAAASPTPVSAVLAATVEATPAQLDATAMHILLPTVAAALFPPTATPVPATPTPSVVQQGNRTTPTRTPVPQSTPTTVPVVSPTAPAPTVTPQPTATTAP